MERVAQYCTTGDGVRIAYCVEGEGPALLVCPYFVESFSYQDLTRWEELMKLLGEGRQLVRYDMRGTGLSQRDVTDISHEALVMDLEAVVAATRLSDVTLWAGRLSAPRAIDYCVRHPSKVSRLVLYGPLIRPDDVPAETANAFAVLARENWDLAAQLFADIGGRGENAAGALQIAELFRESATGEFAARFILQAYESTDVENLLPSVACKTLILHRVKDGLAPFAVGQRIASSVPNSQLLPLKDSAEMFGDVTSAFEAIDEFLGRQRAHERRDADATFRTVLFTDLVGHTEMMSRLGDERGREVLRKHERITREVLKANGGTEVKTMGDGFMASFGSVTKAVECAVALQRAFADHEGEPLSIRVGLNAGEPIEEDGDLFGATVILASRITAKAEGGEILVADTVRGLCSGKGFLFADRGDFVAKGIEEPVRISEVNWRKSGALIWCRRSLRRSGCFDTPSVLPTACTLSRSAKRWR
jgi:class 3 adenylate cyclase/pimeloyl-ACP methyl ester carboxylesterase